MSNTLPVVGLRVRRSPLADPVQQLATLRRLPLQRDFEAALADDGLLPLKPTSLGVLQVNLGKVCNQTCRHCHVDAGPDRRERMTDDVVDACLRALSTGTFATLDLTGGAPELHPRFREIVSVARSFGVHVVDRCNLTILETPARRDLPEFFASMGVEVVCSFPHLSSTMTDRQRGSGVFESSLRALRRLNDIGYGRGKEGLRLVLVSNPVGAWPAGDQAAAEREWKRELERRHGIAFDALFLLTNMPIARYLDWLVESGNLAGYMEKLVAAYNPRAARQVMCRGMISVGWDGVLYDCDFNQMLELPIRDADGRPARIERADFGSLRERSIVTGRHCFGCTAGAGSSCGGATT